MATNAEYQNRIDELFSGLSGNDLFPESGTITQSTDYVDNLLFPHVVSGQSLATPSPILDTLSVVPSTESGQSESGEQLYVPKVRTASNEICNKNLADLNNITKDKPYVCDICEKGFAKKGNLKNHKHTHTGDKRFICDTCGNRFTRSQ